VSLEENKAVICKGIEAVNKRNLDLLNGLYALGCVDHTRQLHGLKAVKQYIATLFKSSPDLQGTIEDMIAEGDKVWVCTTFTGTHTGELHGLAPTGKKFRTTSVDIYRIVDGKVKEGWTVLDLYTHLDFYKKLGVIKYTEKAKKLFPTDVS